MSVKINDEVFARLVGAYPESDTLLFRVSGAFVRDADTNDWSDPVRFRFVRREGAMSELEIHVIDLTATDTDAL